MKKQSGITLVALIITIIVMVILAGVVIVTAVMDGGIIDRAQTALRENERAEVEDIVMASYVYKTTASTNIIGQLDLEETAKAIYSNLTESNYQIKTTAGAEAGSYEDIYTEGATSISLNVEGKQGTYTGTVEKNGLRDGMKIVGDTGSDEVPPVDDDNEEGEGVDALEEYYLNLLNKAYESIEVTEEERNLAQDELIELENVAFWTETGIWCMIENYYYKASEDDYLFSIVDKESDEYKKYSAIANEVLDLLTDLNTLFVGYNYTGDSDYKEEFKVKIENDLGKSVDVKAKSAEDIYLIFQSETDENYEYEYGVYVRGELGEYKVREIQSSNGIGF